MTIFLFNEQLQNFKGNLFEMLFIQRAFSQKDKHSGEIAFPGGKCDGEETDVEAVIREIKEEIGLDANDPTTKLKYLGKSNKNFPYSLNMHSSLAFFFDFRTNELNINRDEIQEFKWVPARHFFQMDRTIFGTMDFPMPYLINTYSSFPSEIKKKLTEQYLTTSFPTIEIGMKEKLWGLTLEMWFYIFEIFSENLTKFHDNEIKNYATREKVLQNLSFAMEEIKTMKTKFNNGAGKGIEELGKMFDYEWRFLIWDSFGRSLAKIKRKLDSGMRFLLYFLLITNFLPKL